MFLTRKIDIDGYDKMHIADYYLELLKLIGIEPKPRNLEFPVSKEDTAWAEEYVRKNGVAETDILVGIIPGGGASWGTTAYRKQWPPQRFARLANEIREKFKARIILFGDAAEVTLCSQVASLIKEPPIMACAKTTLSQLAALLKRCNLVICNDGGPLHLAVSQGTRTISIFGPVDPLVYGPYPAGENNLVIRRDLACQPCYEKFKLKECRYADCLTDIEVSEISAAIDNFLGDEIGGA
ncbi:MAG: glycosyltransferase family 9 protein [Candidatus Omnitrophica bacterium]|nr:glycosyltransferase family 9 protein [Candidatus Omnitrophota bacterium]